MKQRPRIYYIETDKALMWDRWQKGESLNSIARHLDRHHSAIQGILSRTGGIRPPERRRSGLVLTLAEREEISRGVVAGQSIRSIAASLGRAPSTVSREINRHGARRRYRASKADQAAWDRAHRPKACKLAQNRAFARIMATSGCYISSMARDLAELQHEVIARGYKHDFGSSRKLLPEIITSDLRIVDSISFDGGTDPGDDVTMYLIEAPSEKGYLIVSDSFHTDPMKAAFIGAILAQSGG